MSKKNKSSEPTISNIQSMTGFGKGSVPGTSATIEVEIKSVNSRFLDIICKLPRAYQEWESEIRSSIAAALQRGRVEVSVSRQAKSVSANSVSFNRPIFEAYWKSYQAVHKEFGGELGAEDEVPELVERNLIPGQYP